MGSTKKHVIIEITDNGRVGREMGWAGQSLLVIIRLEWIDAHLREGQFSPRQLNNTVSDNHNYASVSLSGQTANFT